MSGDGAGGAEVPLYSATRLPLRQVFVRLDELAEALGLPPGSEIIRAEDVLISQGARGVVLVVTHEALPRGVASMAPFPSLPPWAPPELVRDEIEFAIKRARERQG